MGFDLGHTISSLSKLALRTKRKIDNEKSNKKVKVYELWMNHNYRTYEPTPKGGYKSYIFDGVPVKERNFDRIYPSKYKDEIDKPIGDVFSVEVSSFILNEKSYKILYPYIKNEVQKLEIYKRIASIETREELLDMEDELVDRFGDLPRSASNLLSIALLKAKAHNAYVTEIKGGKKGVRLRMFINARIDVERIPDIVAQYNGMLKFKVETQPYFTFIPAKTYAGAEGDLEFLEDIMDLTDKIGG